MKVAKVFVWLGFIALLAISIPKVAWVVRSYEGTNPIQVHAWGITIDVLWLIPVFIAICIDVLILSLTYAVSNDRGKASQISMWAFIGLLCAFSCYCNLLYNEDHLPDGSIWSNPFVSAITPFILAGVPLFALCYTLILSRLNGKGETLEEKATRLENEKEAKQRIQAVNQGKLTSRLKSVISGVADVTSHARAELLPGSNQDPLPDTPEIQPGSNQDPHTDIQKIQPGSSNGYSGDVDQIQPGSNQDPQMDTPEMLTRYNQDPLPDISPIHHGYIADRVTDSLQIQPGSSNGYKADIDQDPQMDKELEISLAGINGVTRSTSGLYIPLADVSRIHGYSLEYLKKLVNAGTLATKKNDRTMLLVSSVNRYVSSHGRKKIDTSETPALRIIGE